MTDRAALFVRIAPYLLATSPHPRDIMWPVSLLYSREMLHRRGVRSRVMDTWQRVCPPRAIVQAVLAESPTHLFLETRSATAALALDVARGISRLAPSVVIWGIGQHASERPGDFLFHGSPFVGCVNGELEPVVNDLVDDAPDIDGTVVWDEAAGDVRYIGDRARLMDLDALPFLNPEDLEIDRYRMLSLHVPSFARQRWGYLLTSRGCAYRCIFCSPTLRQSYGKRFRGQSPERVAEEMAFLQRRHGVEAFYATDDLFTGDRERVHEICHEILRRGLDVRWTIQTRMDHLDRDLLAHMRAAGCVGVKVGIETGNARVSEYLNKDLEPARVLEMASELRRLGIHLTACYLVGNPTETYEEMEETFRFAREVGALMIQVAYHTPYPGSESYERFASRLQSQGLSHFDGIPPNLSEVADRDLIRFHRNFYLRYYLSPRQMVRYLRHRAVYKLFRGEELSLLAKTGSYLLHEGAKRRLGLANAHPLET